MIHNPRGLRKVCSPPEGFLNSSTGTFSRVCSLRPPRCFQRKLLFQNQIEVGLRSVAACHRVIELDSLTDVPQKSAYAIHHSVIPMCGPCVAITACSEGIPVACSRAQRLALEAVLLLRASLMGWAAAGAGRPSCSEGPSLLCCSGLRWRPSRAPGAQACCAASSRTA